MAPNASYIEICKYIELLNYERNAAVKLLSREFENILTMRKRCKELYEINEARMVEMLGTPADNQIVESDTENSIEVDSSSQMSLSEINDDLISHHSKRSAAKKIKNEAFSPKTEIVETPQFLQHMGTQINNQRNRTGSTAESTGQGGSNKF